MIQKNRPLMELVKIKLIVSDFDGVMTDNRVLVREDGMEHVFCNRADGLGIRLIKKMGVEVIVLSTEENKVVETRCRKLGIECYPGRLDKLACLKDILAEKGLRPDEIAYVGNDINDLECLKLAGYSIVVSDAHEDTKKVSDLVLNTPGGAGVFRELYDLMTKSRRN